MNEDNKINIVTTLDHLKLGAFAIKLLKDNAETSLVYLNAQIDANQIAVPTPPATTRRQVMEVVDDEDLFDKLFDDIAMVFAISPDGMEIEYNDGVREAIKNAIEEHGAEITFRTAENN